MRREIKFRGKRVDTGEWVFGDLFTQGQIRAIRSKEIGTYGELIEVLPETVGQFTGLRDKNGVEIYEGDIVLNEYKEKSLVIWDGIGFRAALNGSKKAIYAPNEYWFMGCKIIGNIHDNPELLEVGP